MRILSFFARYFSAVYSVHSIGKARKICIVSYDYQRVTLFVQLHKHIYYFIRGIFVKVSGRLVRYQNKRSVN